MTNERIAGQLRTHARELEREGGNVYRARAFRRAAEVVERLAIPLEVIFAEKGRPGLEALPGIGASLAYTLEMLVRTGQVHTLRPVNAAHHPTELVLHLPGIGFKMAERLQVSLGISTIEELEEAARTGRLEQIGLTPKQLRSLFASLEAGQRERNAIVSVPAEPSIEACLAVDAEYRAEAQRLGGLPTYRTEREGWTISALFSDSALAHRLGRTRDWVVLSFHHQGSKAGQRTVVTETNGDWQGERVVRGRERECRAHYHSLCVSPSGPEPAA